MRRVGTFFIAVSAALAACASDMAGPERAGSAPASLGPSVTEFIELVNAHRESVGCAALVWHEGAGAVASAHSADMERRDFFAHTNPDGASPFDRLDAAGIGYRAAGENIAFTSGGAAAVLALWLGSPGHRQNIENCAYTHHGVGLEGVYWTHLFLEDPS